MKLMSIVRNQIDRSRFAETVDYLMTIFRNQDVHSKSAQESTLLRETTQYKFFEVYQLDLQTYEFKLKEDIELYINIDLLGEGHFHEVRKATQRRSFQKVKNQNGTMQYKETMLNPPVQWAIKKVKKYEEIDEVPNDVAKQYLALLLAQKFNEILSKTYKEGNQLYLKYVQPYLAVPLFKIETPYIFELELLQDQPDVQFAYFNRPWGDFKTKEDKKGEIRLPHAFSHWTYLATGGKFLVNDV